MYDATKLVILPVQECTCSGEAINIPHELQSAYQLQVSYPALPCPADLPPDRYYDQIKMRPTLDPTSLVNDSLTYPCPVNQCPTCSGQHDGTKKNLFMTAPPSLVLAISRPSTIMASAVGSPSIIDRTRVAISQPLILHTEEGDKTYHPAGFIQ